MVRKRSSTSCWRPNAFTTAWPVKVSSICALRSPGVPPLGDVAGPGLGADEPHRPDRDRHGDQRHEREPRRDREHHRGDADQQQHRREHLVHRLLEALGDVVEVVGDPAEQVAPLLVVDVAQRQGVDLVLGHRAQPEHQPLHHAGDEVRGAEAEHAGAGVHAERPGRAGWCSSGMSIAPLRDARDDDVGAAAEHPRAERR